MIKISDDGIVNGKTHEEYDRALKQKYRPSGRLDLHNIKKC